MTNVVRKFAINRPIASGLSIIRVDRELSGQNRRLYRQGRTYRCKVELVGDRSYQLDVFKLRDSFMLKKAYELAMREWNQSYQAADEVTKDNVKARWRDFRIDTRLALNDEFTQSFTLSSTGTGVRGVEVVVDEYEIAEAYTADTGATRDFALRSDANTFDILAEYDRVGKVQADPNAVTTTAAYEDLNANLRNSEVADLQGNGNLPPYDADSVLPGEVLEYVGTIYHDPGNAGTSKTTTGYFDAPLGAIFTFGNATNVTSIKDINGGPLDILCNVEVQAGDYKGVKAEPFVDAKKLGSGHNPPVNAAFIDKLARRMK